MEIKNKQLADLIKRADISYIDEAIYYTEAEEENINSDLDEIEFIIEEVENLWDKYTDRDTYQNMELTEARKFLKETDNGNIPMKSIFPPVFKYLPEEIKKKRKKANIIIEEYERTKLLRKELNKLYNKIKREND